MSVDLRANGVYPLSYFDLAGTQRDQITNPVFWASASRYASVDPENLGNYLSSQNGGTLTSEILHLDFGRTREINYLTMDMLRLPVNVTIEYDALSLDDEPSVWTAVVPHPDAQFDDRSQFQSNRRNPWLRSDFHFTDADGVAVTTRYVRITFTRRDEPFPTPQITPFTWPIVVKSLRTARLIGEYADTRSTLLETTAVSGTQDIITPSSQSFGFDSTVVRGEITPNMLGFSVLADVLDPDNVSLSWTISDETGVIDQATTSQASGAGLTWLSWNLDRGSIPIDLDSTFTLTVHSLNPTALTTVQTTDTYASPITGDAGLALRIFGDIADSGQDVLGNTYRSATVLASAEGALEAERSGWTSAPQPAIDAVESLYMDVRVQGDAIDGLGLGVIDALNVDPLTPGVYMHVYYTQTMLTSRAPDTAEEWEAILWTPINDTFVLRGPSTFELPQQIQASFIKLEFSNLTPRPYEEPAGISLPPVQYRRYPSWVQAAFADPSSQNAANQFLPSRSLTTQTLVNQIVLPSDGADQNGRIVRKAPQVQTDTASIDPTTASKISFNLPGGYQAAQPALVKRDNLLGNLTAKTYTRNVSQYSVENIPAQPAGIRTVSSLNNRANEAQSQIAPPPMWFNRQCLHQYQVTQAAFNGKAYYVGIANVSFLRFDHTVTRDDALIEDSLYDSAMLDSVTFETLVRDQGTQIPSALSDGSGGYVVNVWADYVADGGQVRDEPLALAGTLQVTLAQPGVATNIAVKSQPGSNGITYSRGDDYDISFRTDTTGQTLTSVGRSFSGSRLIVPHSADSGFTYVDGGFVISAFQGYGVDVFDPPLPYADLYNPTSAQLSALSSARASNSVGPVRSFFQGFAASEQHIRQGVAANPATDSFTYSDTAVVGGAFTAAASSTRAVFRDGQTGTTTPARSTIASAGSSNAILHDGLTGASAPILSTVSGSVPITDYSNFIQNQDQITPTRVYSFFEMQANPGSTSFGTNDLVSHTLVGTTQQNPTGGVRSSLPYNTNAFAYANALSGSQVTVPFYAGGSTPQSMDFWVRRDSTGHGLTTTVATSTNFNMTISYGASLGQHPPVLNIVPNFGGTQLSIALSPGEMAYVGITVTPATNLIEVVSWQGTRGFIYQSTTMSSTSTAASNIQISGLFSDIATYNTSLVSSGADQFSIVRPRVGIGTREYKWFS